MIKSIAKFIALFILSLLLTIACTKDEEIVQMDKTEAVELLNSTSLLMEETLNQMIETNGMTLMMHFISLNESTPISKSDIRSFLNPFYLKPLLSKPYFSKEEDLNFDTPFGNYGTYTWDSSLSSWDFVADPIDKIIYHFPSDQNQTLNNANLTIASIEQVVDLDNKFKNWSTRGFWN